MTNEQIKWAQQHDWYLGVTDDKRVICQDYNKNGDSCKVFFDCFKLLKEWAGY